MATTQTYKIGDAYQLIKDLPSDSIDLVVTDPPYGYSFMGLDWDKTVPKIEIWKECMRVLKPGAFAFVMSSPRQDVLSQMIVRIGEVGFDTGFTSIYWTYASGFPKALNIGKAIDKKAGIQRTIVGRSNNGSGANLTKLANHKKGDTGIGTCDVSGKNFDITIATSPEAKVLDGSYAGFQPKSAVEVIIIAMKPLSEKTYVEQALKNGKGITWIDDCRIPYENDDLNTIKRNFMSERKYVGDNWKTPEDTIYKMGIHQCASMLNKEGRFPANVLISDDILNDGSISKGGGKATTSDRLEFEGYTDSGSSYSRYFDLDKWFNETIKKLPQEAQKTFPFLIVEKASKNERNKGVRGIEKEIGHNRFDTCAVCGGYILQNPDRPSACKCIIPVRKDNKVSGNFHPTVKPLKLFSYLVTLGSRPNDVVVDPFLGSGTTLRVCRLLGRNFIGFDINPEYEPIIKGRSMSEQLQIKEYLISNIMEA